MAFPVGLQLRFLKRSPSVAAEAGTAAGHYKRLFTASLVEESCDIGVAVIRGRH